MNRDTLCTFYIVRHGETEWNVVDRMQGQLDSLLTRKGVEQAGETAKRLKHVSFDAIFSSDLIRAKRTAEIIKLDRELEVVVRGVLRERMCGRFEGKLIEEYRRETRHLFGQYKKLSEQEQWKFKFDEGYESDEELMSRFIIFLREVAVAYPNKTILVVTHGAVIKTFLAHIGFAKLSELRASTFRNAGHLKVQSDGVDFWLQEVRGYQRDIEKNIE
jgi:broad specificity phosphatase PhoE